VKVWCWATPFLSISLFPKRGRSAVRCCIKQFAFLWNLLNQFWRWIATGLVAPLLELTDHLGLVPDSWKQHLGWLIPQWGSTGWA
jgi:hypothetical protein